MKRIRDRRVWEGVLLALIVAVALGLRLWRLDTVPDGLHYDEAIDLMEGRRLLSGEWFLYTPAGWGREGIFYYGVALMLSLTSSPILALRLTAVLFGTSAILTGYGLARYLTDAPTALITASWLAVLQWSLFESRIGLRNITVLALLLPAVWAFWWAFSRRRDAETDKTASYRYFGRFALAGGLLGLSLYTYQPARFAPFIFLFFALYLALFHRARLRECFSGFAVYGLVAGVVALPLILILWRGTDAEAQRQWVIEPLLRLLDGDPSLVWQNFVATVKMFTISGDPLVTYNVPGRPVFVPSWTGILFYVGLALTLWRWRRPRYAFFLIWLGVMTLPTLLTVSAPNFNRLLGTLFVVALLAALPLGEAARFLARRRGIRYAALPAAVALLVLGLNAEATVRDYFTQWATVRPENYAEQYNMGAVAIARHLAQQPPESPLLVNTRNLEDADPYIAAAIVGDYLPNLRWVDTAQAVAFPEGIQSTRLYLGEYRQLDDRLAALTGAEPAPEAAADRYEVFRLSSPEWVPLGPQRVMALPPDQLFDAGRRDQYPSLTLPASFDQRLRLDDVQVAEATVAAGETVTLFTYWTVLRDGEPLPLSFFLHLIDDQSEIVSQEDGLGYPPHSWRAGDRFVHVHRLSTAPTPPAATYWLQLGIYNRDTLARWPLPGVRGPADRLIIGSVSVEAGAE